MPIPGINTGGGGIDGGTATSGPISSAVDFARSFNAAPPEKKAEWGIYVAAGALVITAALIFWRR